MVHHPDDERKQLILDFFSNIHNLKFITQGYNADGTERAPTLYFQDTTGNMGRLRQDHNLNIGMTFMGIETHSERVFLNDAGQDEYNHLKEDPDAGADFVTLLSQARTEPQDDDRVVEFCGSLSWDPDHKGGAWLYEHEHGSSGTVVLLDLSDPNTTVEALIEMPVAQFMQQAKANGQYNDWTIGSAD